MGLLSGLLGDASEVDIQQLENELAFLLISHEQAEKAFKLIRDLFIFTNKRLIIIDKQGLTGKRTEYLSIPYSSISHFSVQTAGHLDLDSELDIWLIGRPDPIRKQFKRSSNLEAVQKALAQYTLNANN